MTTPLHRNRLYAWIAASMVIVGALAIARGVMGAERFNQGPHAIVLFIAPDPAEPNPNDRRNTFVLSGAYEDRAACNRAKLRLVVMVRGGRVVCLPYQQE